MKKTLIFSTSTELVRIVPEGLVYISAEGNYCTLMTANGTARLLTMQLHDVEDLIDEQLGEDSVFVRYGRSLIINTDYVYTIDIPKQLLILSDHRFINFTVSASKDALRELKEEIEKGKRTRK